MRVMAHYAFNVRIVFVRVYAPDFGPSACWIVQAAMASKT